MQTPQSHTAQIRKALNIAFDDSALSAFCFDYFLDVYDKFSQGMRKDDKITLLLDDCRRLPNGFEKLLDAVRDEYETSNGKREELSPLIDALEAYIRPSLHIASTLADGTGNGSGHTHNSPLTDAQPKVFSGLTMPQVQKPASIPLRVDEDYMIDIYLHISAEGNSYSMDIVTEGQALRTSIGMSQHDLASLCDRLHDQMRKMAQTLCQATESFTDHEEALFWELAEVGHLAFNRLFAQGGAADAINELIERNQRLSFQIASADFFLPWECLYPKELDQPLDIQSFWGMKYFISRVIPRNNWTGFVPPDIKVTSVPNVGLLTYLKLHGVREKEVPFFNRLDKENRIKLFKLRALNPKKKREELRVLRAFWLLSLDLVHLACHASHNQDYSDLSSILLSDEFSISLQDIENYVKEINRNPLLILNACEMGNMKPLYSSYFAALFLKYGVRGGNRMRSTRQLCRRFHRTTLHPPPRAGAAG